MESRTQRGTPPHHRLLPPPLGHLFVRIWRRSSCCAVQDGENVCRRALNGAHSSLSFGKLSSIACCGALAGHDELRLRYIGCTHRAIFNTRALAIRQSIFPSCAALSRYGCNLSLFIWKFIDGFFVFVLQIGKSTGEAFAAQDPVLHTRGVVNKAGGFGDVPLIRPR